MEKGGLEEEKRRVYSEAEFGAGASTSGKHSKKGGGGGGESTSISRCTVAD